MRDKTVFLVGHTGFVGSNLLKEYNKFTMVANSKNVDQMYELEPDVLIYAGVTGTKWYACRYKDKDYEIIENAKRNILRIKPKKLVLISTVDVYDDLEMKNEDYTGEGKQINVYGLHRLQLEYWVKENVVDYHIIRLPAIYGINLKKNFVYDMIHVVPGILTSENLKNLQCEIEKIESYYELRDDGLYYLKYLRADEKKKLREQFIKIDYNALSFTNAKSEYQFYNLKWLWGHIGWVIDNDVRVINLVTEPVSAAEIYRRVYGKKFENDSVADVKYNLHTKYDTSFGGKNGYLYTKESVISDLVNYILKGISEICL